MLCAAVPPRPCSGFTNRCTKPTADMGDRLCMPGTIPPRLMVWTPCRISLWTGYCSLGGEVEPLVGWITSGFVSEKYALAAQPIASVNAAAVVALIMFPSPGTHPTRACEIARPPMLAENVNNRSVAAVFVIVTPCSWAMRTIMPP